MRTQILFCYVIFVSLSERDMTRIILIQKEQDGIDLLEHLVTV